MQQKKIGAVILAAGMSKRMGEPKLLLSLNGKPLFLHAVDLAQTVGLTPIVLVVGEQEENIRRHLAEREGINVLRNEDFGGGMGSSLKKGIKWMAQQEVAASFVMLADQPFIPTEVIADMLDCYHQERANRFLIFRPIYQEQVGHPILFDSTLFREFEQLEGDIGGKLIIARHTDRQKYVPFENSSWNIDIDTPEDYKKIGKKGNNGQ